MRIERNDCAEMQFGKGLSDEGRGPSIKSRRSKRRGVSMPRPGLRGRERRRQEQFTLSGTERGQYVPEN